LIIFWTAKATVYGSRKSYVEVIGMTSIPQIEARELSRVLHRPYRPPIMPSYRTKPFHMAP
jgi:hypothetical protein